MLASGAIPAILSASAKRDEALKVAARGVFEENIRVYGARKVWRAGQYGRVSRLPLT